MTNYGTNLLKEVSTTRTAFVNSNDKSNQISDNTLIFGRTYGFVEDSQSSSKIYTCNNNDQVRKTSPNGATVIKLVRLLFYLPSIRDERDAFFFILKVSTSQPFPPETWVLFNSTFTVICAIVFTLISQESFTFRVMITNSGYKLPTDTP